ncbi:kinase-like domain-containing protein [Gigaspora rosea]|uniref:Kinase-like domain-containing protein n=1 Tax=Gigaspora rosea TaxID=44941 RepID=A0A397VH18_9GLOM|nr:kinase-like domain-containing protein [Gigaspora rosea]
MSNSTNQSLSEFSDEYLRKIEEFSRGHNIRRFDYSQLNIIKAIGCGGSATVYKADFEEESYAVKSLKINIFMDEKTFRKIMRELGILHKISHPNIIKFYGISSDPIKKNFVMVLQFANSGSLRTYLQTKKKDGIYKITFTELGEIAKGIVNGLKYLHENEIIHRDLHSENILINEGKALVADFGKSREFDDDTPSSSKARGMIPYVDPQHLLEKAVANTPPEYVNLYKRSWSSDPDKRPTLSEILTELEKLSVVQKILEKGGIISRYFIQRLNIHVDNIDTKKNKTCWANNIPTTVITCIFNEAKKRLNIDLSELFRNNDMKLFDNLLNYSHDKEKNLKSIKQLILNWKFIPHPPRPKNQRLDEKILQIYPAEDGYENHEELRIIARAILICNNLINDWKEIGYHDIVYDINDLVIEEAFHMLFPSGQTTSYIMPSEERITQILQQLLGFGFKLTYSVIFDLIQFFEPKLNDIGERIFNFFILIQENDPRNLYSTQELRKDFFTKIVIEAIKPKSNFKNIESLKVIYKSIGLECEAVFMEAMMYHRDKSSFYANEKEKMIEHPYSNERIPNYKHLLFNSLYYEWIITEFSEDSELAVFSFNDILRTIISMDKFNQNTDEKVPSCTYDEICNVCKVYCDDKNFFSVSHLKLLKQVYHTEFLEPLFEFYLPELVELQVNFTIKDNKTLLKKKEILEWLNAIKIIYDDI